MKGVLFTITLGLIISGVCFGENDKTIYLCEEDHGSAKDKEFSSAIIDLACEGQLFYVMEGLEREASAEKQIREFVRESFGVKGEPYLYGIENPLWFTFVSIFDLNQSLTRPNIIQPKGKAKLAIILKLINQSNQHFLSVVWNHEKLVGNSIFDYLKEKKDLLTEEMLSVSYVNANFPIEKWTNAEWIDFTHQLVLMLGPIVAERIPVEKLESLMFLLSCLVNPELDSNCSNEDFLIDTLYISLRNYFIINNLEEIYTITKDKKKPIISILGYLHVEEVKKGLENKGFLVLGKRELLGLMNEKGEL